MYAYIYKGKQYILSHFNTLHYSNIQNLSTNFFRIVAFRPILKDVKSESKNISFVFFKGRMFFVKDFYICAEC